MGNEKVLRYGVCDVMKWGRVLTAIQMRLNGVVGRYTFVCLLVFGGCGTKRDLLFDPVNTPIIIPIHLTYQDQEGSVLVAWRYLGLQPPSRFRFVRVERDGFHLLKWEDLPAPSRKPEERADVWDMLPVVDASLNAGEHYRYILRTETALKQPAEETMGSIQIPGARLKDIVVNPASGTATVEWHLAAGEPVQYELLRQQDDELSEVIFQSDQFADTSFVDVLPVGNREYVYTLRNYFHSNVMLDSRSVSLHPYPRSELFDVSESSDIHLMLNNANALGSPMLVLQARSDAIAVRNLGRTGYIIESQLLPVPNPERFKQASLSIGVTPIGEPPFPHVLLTGVLADTNRVQLLAFESIGSGFVAKLWQHTMWEVNDPNAVTTVALGSNGQIFVGVERQVRVFHFEENGIVELGKFDFPNSQSIQSMAVFASGVWVVTTGGQVFRSSSIQATLGEVVSPVWEEVVLPADAYAIGISGDEQGVYVLDQAQKRVLVFDFDGQPGLWWRGLDDLDLSTGGLAVSQVGDVYVWDAQNRMIHFRNAPASLERFTDGAD